MQRAWPFVFLLACRAPATEADVTPTATAAADAPPMSASAPANAPTAPNAPIGNRLTVHFGSICCGTDSAAEQRLEQVAVPKGVKHELAYWGKEGERDDCFDLSGLDPNERAAFAKLVRDAVAKGENVVVDSAECHEGR